MHSKFALTAIAAAMVFASSFVQSAEIYPVDKARFLTNARFDFKVELDTVVDRNDIKIEINGADYRKVLTGDEIFVGEEIDAKASAVLMRDVEIKKPGTYKVTVSGKGGNKTVVWNTYDTPKKRQAKNVILLLADGLSVGHRTAARIMSKGVVNGMYNAPLAMDDMPNMALLGTSSVDTIAADSANTASAYMTGHKSSVNALGVYVDRTKATQDDPRQETIAELIRRKTSMAVGVVSDAELEDATPASVVSHTRRRADKADIVGMFYDVKPEVMLGGGSAYFLPKSTAGSKRKDNINYIDLFQKAGYELVTDRDAMLKAAEKSDRLLGLFHTGNMDGWLDRHQFKGNTVKKFPNQPDLTDSFHAAIKVLEKNKEGFFLMLEAGLVDKFSHPLDWTRSVAETIAFDKVVEAAQKYCDEHPDTLLIVTGDHTHSIAVAGTIDDKKKVAICAKRLAFTPRQATRTTRTRIRTASRTISIPTSVWPYSSVPIPITTKPIVLSRTRPLRPPLRMKKASTWQTPNTRTSRGLISLKATYLATSLRAYIQLTTLSSQHVAPTPIRSRVS